MSLEPQEKTWAQRVLAKCQSGWDSTRNAYAKLDVIDPWLDWIFSLPFELGLPFYIGTILLVAIVCGTIFSWFVETFSPRLRPWTSKFPNLVRFCKEAVDYLCIFSAIMGVGIPIVGYFWTGPGAPDLWFINDYLPAYLPNDPFYEPLVDYKMEVFLDKYFERYPDSGRAHTWVLCIATPEDILLHIQRQFDAGINL